MKYTQFGIVLCLAACPVPIFAETFLPTAQDKYFEAGAELLQQETSALRLSFSYLMNMGLPSFVSKIGLDLGFHVFDADDGRIFAPEYGFFLESTVLKFDAYTGYLKTGLYTLAFPEADSSASSMSSVAVEWGMERQLNGLFLEIGLGVRYWNKDDEPIRVGQETIEKTWLFYPKIGIGGRFQ
jgi:hypothetical protein